MYFLCGCVIGFLGLSCLDLIDSNDKLIKKIDEKKKEQESEVKHE